MCNNRIMKKLKKFEKEINKCSKCGLCQAVCPIFQVTGNECAVSKGKFVMLSGVLKGDLNLNENMTSYLDLCTKCNKCSNFCPAGINVCEILQTAKSEVFPSTKHYKLVNFLQSAKFFDTLIDILQEIAEPFRTKIICTHPTQKILYFKGCVNEAFPKRENALKKILTKAKIKLLERDFSCCGLPFFSSGNLERFEEVKEENTNVINMYNVDYILTDCASCENTLKSYKTINKTIINAETLISTLNFKFKFNKPQHVTFHKPCHLENTQFLNAVLNKCENVEFTEIPDSCCGLAGEFALKNFKISNKLANKRAKEIIDSGAKIILTSCPACTIGLKKALWQNFKFNIKVMNIIDFLSKADEIEYTPNP